MSTFFPKDFNMIEGEEEEGDDDDDVDDWP